MSKQSVIVTGAASGIGRAAAFRFADAGYAVTAADVNEEVRSVGEELEQRHGGARAAVVDVSDEAAMGELVDDHVAAYGGLDAFFANAGILGPMVGFDELRGQDFEAVWRVNVLGPFHSILHGSRVMRAAGRGAIVCTASVAGLRAGAGPMAYSASKAAVINMVQLAAQELAGTGVRVNALCPGLVETGMTRPLFAGARAVGKEDKIGQLNPLRRAGLDTEIADAALFLASDQSSYLNGHALVVDGGLSASHPFAPGKRW